MLWVCEIRGTISRLANIRGTSIPSDEAIDYRCGTKQYNDPPTQHATREHDFILGIHIQWLCLYTVLLWPRIINFPYRHVIYCRLDFTGLCLTTCYGWLSTTCFHSTWRAVTNSNILQTNAKPTTLLISPNSLTTQAYIQTHAYLLPSWVCPQPPYSLAALQDQSACLK